MRHSKRRLSLRLLTVAGVLVLFAASAANAGFITYSGAGTLQYLEGNPFDGFGDTPTAFDFRVTVDMNAPNSSSPSFQQFRILFGELNIDGREATLLPNFDGSSSTINVQDASADFFGFNFAFTIDGVTSKFAGSFRFPKGTFSFDDSPPVFTSLTTSGEGGVISGNSREFGRVQTWTEAGAVLTAETTAVPEPSSLALLGMGGLTLLGYGRRRSRSRQHPAPPVC